MKKSRFPEGWNEARVRKVLAHYERQTDTETVAEDEADYEDRSQTAMTVPIELVLFGVTINVTPVAHLYNENE